MSYQVPRGEIESFIGIFNRVNMKAPPARPEVKDRDPLEQIVLSKGMIQIGLSGEMLTVNVPEDDQVDTETYNTHLDLLVDGLCELIQVHQYRTEIRGALAAAGIVVRFQGPLPVMNPLTQAAGEISIHE